MLDKLPAWLRHALIAVAAAALTVIGTAISNGGISTLNWKDLGAAVAAAAISQIVLILTPLTQQYGVGAPPPPGEPQI